MRGRLIDLVASGLGLLLAWSLWLPWVDISGSTRSSFGAFRSAQRLGLDELAPLRVIWFLVPVFGLAVAGAVLLGFRKLAAVALASFALVILGVGLFLLVSDVSAWGVFVSGGLSLGALAWSLLMLRSARRSNSY